MDGANMNAQVGLCRPGDIGADVCHLNLHKTFCIPHGGGGPGMGPIGVAAHLVPFLPGHPVVADGRRTGDRRGVRRRRGAARASCRSRWVYITHDGRRRADAARRRSRSSTRTTSPSGSKPHYPGAVQGQERHGRARVHRRPARRSRQRGVEVGGHRQAPDGLRLPRADGLVPGRRHADDRADGERVEGRAGPVLRRDDRDPRRDRAGGAGALPRDDNPLKHAPHTAGAVHQPTRGRMPTRARGGVPAPWVREHKFWPAVGRIDNAYGDRNLVCACPPLEAYAVLERQQKNNRQTTEKQQTDHRQRSGA